MREFIHNMAKWAIKHKILAPGAVVKECKIFDTYLLNPLGLAAGFDKNGELINQMPYYGFGYVEVGSVTRRPCAGTSRDYDGGFEC